MSQKLKDSANVCRTMGGAGPPARTAAPKPSGYKKTTQTVKNAPARKKTSSILLKTSEPLSVQFGGYTGEGGKSAAAAKLERELVVSTVTIATSLLEHRYLYRN